MAIFRVGPPPSAARRRMVSGPIRLHDRSVVMKVAVYGASALGGCFGARLDHIGLPVPASEATCAILQPWAERSRVATVP